MHYQHKGWHSRGYLPHFDSCNFTQFVTFRLFDSMPQEVIRSIENERLGLPLEKVITIRYRKNERWLDSGYGSCFLRKIEISQIIEDSLSYLHSSCLTVHA